MLTRQEFQEAMPTAMRKNVSQELIDHVNKVICASPEEMELHKDNMLTYTKVLTEGKYKVQDYMAACMYVSYRTMGFNTKESWSKVFPDRYARLKAQGKSDKDISAHVAAYNANSLVFKIYERSLTPVRIQYRDVQYKMIRNLTKLAMDEDVSPRDRVAASNSLLVHLKDPETAKTEIDVSINQGSVIDGLKEALGALAQQQINSLQVGSIVTKDITDSVLVIGNE